MDENMEKTNLLAQLRTIKRSIKYIKNHSEQYSAEDIQKIEHLEKKIPKNLSKIEASEIRNIESNYNCFVINIWKKYLSTQIDDPKGIFLVHRMRTFINGEFNSPLISCSLVTPQHYGLFASPKELTNEDISIGLIINPKHIVLAQDHDTSTFNDKDQDSDELVVAAHNYTIQTPQEIMNNILSRTKNRNGEILNYLQHEFYSEIVCDDYDIIGVFARTVGGIDELSIPAREKFEAVKEYAKGINMPFKHFDIEQARIRNGLSGKYTQDDVKYSEETEYMINKHSRAINYELINELYMGWLNEQNPTMQGKKREYIKRNILPEDLLMYSIRFAIPFEAFRNIFSLGVLFETLVEMEKRGEDITDVTSKILVIQGVEDIQELNQFSKKGETTNVRNFRLKFQGSNLFEWGDVKKIGQKFPYACVNFIDIESIEQMIKEEKDFKGVPITITIDNMGQLPLDKLSNIEKSFDVDGIRIIEKDRNVKIEQRSICLTDYRQIRRVVDNEIINKLYVTENASKMAIDAQLATQIFCLISDKVKYDKEFKGAYRQVPPEKWFSYYSDVSNIMGIVTGKAICGGYAEILRNVLSCVDIKSKTIVGKTVSDAGHAWNQIELGNTWFNTDLTWGEEQIREVNASGQLFMSDVAFFGDRRDMIFDQGKYKEGESIETEATVGGHTMAFNTNSEKCDCYLSPYVTTALIRRAREYEEEYKRHGKSSDYKGAVPYVGSSVEKMRSSSKNIETPKHSERI